MMRILLLIILFAGTRHTTYSQEGSIPLRYSWQEGTYFYFADRAIGRTTPLEGITRIRISRDVGKGFKPLVEVSQKESIQDFKTTSGEKAWEQLKIMKNIPGDDLMFQYIKQHPSLQDYGMMSFSIRFRQAMGTAYLDKDAAGLAAGKQWTYRVEFLNASGTVTKTSTGTIQGGPGVLAVDNIKMQRAFATDSAVYLTWSSPSVVQTEGMLMAEVYRQVAGKGRFIKLSDPIIANVKSDSVIFYIHEKVVPQTLYRYYLRAKDTYGNISGSSDTISVLSIDFASLPLLQELNATDTTNAILLQWQPLRNVPQVVGVEIQRSRDVRGNYVVLDTASASQTTYLDSRIFPDVPYFYRLRIIGLQGMERETGYSGYATAVVKNRLKNPDPPYNLTAVLDHGGVKLQWEAGEDTDLYGYFVYRAATEQSRFDVISSGLTTNEFTDTARISGRTQYVYAVKAVNNNSLESDFSNKVSIRQSVADLPLAPAGLNAYMDKQTVVLSWPSTAQLDHNIAGYNIYRREARKGMDFNQKQSAAAQATALGFTLLNNQIITVTGFEDPSVSLGLNYEYAIASVDVFGIESTYSPFAAVSTQPLARIIQICTIRKVTGGVLLEWDPSLLDNTESVIVFRKKAGDTNFQRITTLKKGEISYLDRNAERGVLYIYQVAGQKGNNTISRSEEKNIRL